MIIPHEILQPLRLGSRIELRVPDGDNLPRFVCADCGTIHYQNPKVVVGCLPEWEDRVLLCRRAIEPRLRAVDAARRVPRERRNDRRRRRCARRSRRRARGSSCGDLYTMISLPQISQVYMMFRARLLDLDFGPGPESLEVRLFDEDEIPWEDARVPHDHAGRCATISSTASRARFPMRVSTLERRPPLPPDLLAAG